MAPLPPLLSSESADSGQRLLKCSRRSCTNTDDGGKRARPVPTDEANEVARKFIAEKEKAGENCTARDVSVHCKIGLGRVTGSPAWKAYQKRKKSAHQNGKPKERQLSDKMLANIGKVDDPSEKLVNAEEKAWRYLLEKASTPDERARLNSMKPAEKAEIIRLVLEQWGDQDDCNKTGQP